MGGLVELWSFFSFMDWTLKHYNSHGNKIMGAKGLEPEVSKLTVTI